MSKSGIGSVRGLLRILALVFGIGLLGLGVAVPAGAAVHTPSDLSDCQAPGATGAYPPSSGSIGLSSTSVPAGGTVGVTGTGFAESGQTGNTSGAQLTLCSTPTSLGTVPLTSDGTFSETVTIPSDTPAGEHIIQATGSNGQGGTTTLSTEITITAPGTAAAGSSGSLPFTGFDIIPVVLAGLALVVVGGALIAVARNRRQGRTTA